MEYLNIDVQLKATDLQRGVRHIVLPPTANSYDTIVTGWW